MEDDIMLTKQDHIHCPMTRYVLLRPQLWAAYHSPHISLRNTERLGADITDTQAELERIDIKHHVIMLLMGGNLHFAPLVNPKNILDIGTGTGIWAMEMADQYPDAMVIGTDLSPVQPMWYENIFRVRFGKAVQGCQRLTPPGFRTTFALRSMMWKANGSGGRTTLITYIHDS